MDRLETYQPNSSMTDQEFRLPHIQKTRTGIIYNLLRMFSFDQEKCKVIFTIGKKLGLVEKQIEEIQNFFDEEEFLRRKRAAVLFPSGFNDILQEYEKLR